MTIYVASNIWLEELLIDELEEKRLYLDQYYESEEKDSHHMVWVIDMEEAIENGSV